MSKQKIAYLLVSGSQTIKDKDFVFSCLDKITSKYEIQYLIEGEAKGVDIISRLYAKEHNIEVIPMKAKWNKYGRGAGIIRNSEMVNLCSKGLAIWDGTSRGTKDTIEKLRKAGKLLRVFYYSDKSIKRQKGLESYA